VVGDDETPPFASVHIRAARAIGGDLDEHLRCEAEIGARDMGAEHVPPAPFGDVWLVVRITPERVIAETDVAGYRAPRRTAGSGPGESRMSRWRPSAPLAHHQGRCRARRERVAPRSQDGHVAVTGA